MTLILTKNRYIKIFGDVILTENKIMNPTGKFPKFVQNSYDDTYLDYSNFFGWSKTK
jgi:hypothetical protein